MLRKALRISSARQAVAESRCTGGGSSGSQEPVPGPLWRRSTHRPNALLFGREDATGAYLGHGTARILVEGLSGAGPHVEQARPSGVCGRLLRFERVSNGGGTEGAAPQRLQQNCLRGFQETDRMKSHGAGVSWMGGPCRRAMPPHPVRNPPGVGAKLSRQRVPLTWAGEAVHMG